MSVPPVCFLLPVGMVGFDPFYSIFFDSAGPQDQVRASMGGALGSRSPAMLLTSPTAASPTQPSNLLGSLVGALGPEMSRASVGADPATGPGQTKLSPQEQLIMSVLARLDVEVVAAVAMSAASAPGGGAAQQAGLAGAVGTQAQLRQGLAAMLGSWGGYLGTGLPEETARALLSMRPEDIPSMTIQPEVWGVEPVQAMGPC